MIQLQYVYEIHHYCTSFTTIYSTVLTRPLTYFKKENGCNLEYEARSAVKYDITSSFPFHLKRKSISKCEDDCQSICTVIQFPGPW